ncbi:sodium-translocating pyrophosphatase [Candidatus Sumerlaeota bacterium]|nr:sodium-translocating pyrophosphatase [Candidatus Sumerlaeota bacterium]
MTCLTLAADKSGLPPWSGSTWLLWLFALACGLGAMWAVTWLRRDVLSRDEGSEEMKQISQAVQEGASAFLGREYKWIALFVAIIFALLLLAPMFSDTAAANGLSGKTGIAFLVGALMSALAGYNGMYIATRSNARTAQAAHTGGMEPALSVAISGGAVMGLGVVGFSIIGLCAVLFIFDFQPVIVNGYAMGASLVALFARSGGGIYTKGADMGADLVGKVEQGIPEDDPRNPATIADNVGDNVGDVAGLGSDLMESYVESIIAAMALASVTAFAVDAAKEASVKMSLMILPLALAGLGIIASILGVAHVKFFPGRDAQKSLMHGTYVAAISFIVFAFIACAISGLQYGSEGVSSTNLHTWMGIFKALVLGVIGGVAVGFLSEVYTSAKFGGVRKLADECRMGPAITVTGGIGLGMKSTGWAVLALIFCLLGAYLSAGYYGIAIAAFGMLATTGMIVAVDAYGPIADNAGGIAEMAHMPPEVRGITDNLDAVGNTTAAIGKGFAIGSAAFAAMGLLVAFVHSADITRELTLTNPAVIAGLLGGAMLPFVFSAMLFKAVGKAAFNMIDEVRRQLREKPGIMEGKDRPDYAQCVAISTDGAIRGMLFPGAMAIAVPIIIGLTGYTDALAGLLIGALASGLMLGIFCANSGGAMDNAKKYIEEGKITDPKTGEVQGKGSETHKAAVVGDTVGDPLKDTVGPSINILIKLMAVISLVFAPLF